MGRHAGFTGNRMSLIDRVMAEFAKKPSEGTDLMSLNLTENEKEILERWIFIDNLIRKHRPKLKISDIENLTRSRYKISDGQFWADYRNADRLFGTSFALSKDYARSIYIEHLEQLSSLAEASGDYKSAIKALEVAAKLRRLEEKDEIDDTPEPNKYMMVFVLNKTSNKGTVEEEVEVLDLEKLNKLRPDRFQRIMDAVDQPLIGEKEMKEMLDGNN
jgi:hypothetical protein